jgi:hypothetical protein
MVKGVSPDDRKEPSVIHWLMVGITAEVVLTAVALMLCRAAAGREPGAWRGGRASERIGSEARRR